MAIKPKFKKSDFNKLGVAMIQRIENAILSRFEYIGETFVNNARSKSRAEGGFGNITGNLRSSISYMILKDGKSVKENFEKSGNGNDGIQTSKALLRELKAKFNTGYVLIVVAGMKYAASVESRGLDVITGSSLIAEKELREAIEGLKRKVSKR